MRAFADVERRLSRAAGSLCHKTPGYEAIEMVERQFGYFPQSFRYRGRRYGVQAVERCWTTPGRGGRVQHHCFRVRCGEDTFNLYRDARHHTWRLQRVVAGVSR
jgi:hypothetical protein